MEGPATCPTLLGIDINTLAMELWLPQRIWVDRMVYSLAKQTIRQKSPLVGLLQHASQVVRPNRIFVWHLYNLLAQPASSSHTSWCVSTRKPKLMSSGGQHLSWCGMGPPSFAHFACETLTSRSAWMRLGTGAAVPFDKRIGNIFAGIRYPFCQQA